MSKRSSGVFFYLKTQFIIYFHIRKKSYNLKKLISLKKTSKLVKKINRKISLSILISLFFFFFKLKAQKYFNVIPLSTWNIFISNLIIFYNKIQSNIKIFFDQNNHVKSRLKHVINTKSQINILFKEKIEKKKNDERRK